MSQSRQKRPKRSTDAKAGRKGRGVRPSQIRKREKARERFQAKQKVEES